MPEEDQTTETEAKADEGPKYDLAAINEERKKLGRPELTEDAAKHAAANAGSQDLTFHLVNATAPPSQEEQRDEQRDRVARQEDRAEDRRRD